MVGEEATGDHRVSVDQVQWLKSDGMKGDGVGILNRNDCGEGSSGMSEGFLHTYKRRKHGKSSSESNKGLEDEKPSTDTAAQSVDQWTSAVLEHMYQSLSGDQHGIQASFPDAFMKTEFDSCVDGRHRSSAQRGRIPNATSHGEEKDFNDKCNGALGNPCVTEMCRNVFLSVVLSDKFTSLCKLLHENFRGVKVDNLFSLNLINKRMKEGTYENSPFLFSADFEQLWRKIQAIGTELTSVAKSLLDISASCFNQQVRGSQQLATSEVGKNEFCYRKSDSHDKLEQKETGGMYRVCCCRHCGDKADWSNCLVCDSCEEMYHVSCVDPPVEEIPPKSWYCGSCIARGMGSPHDDCIVCERLKASWRSSNQASNQINSTNDVSMFNEHEEASNDSTNCAFRREKECVCKICGSEVNDGEKLKICDHDFCSNKYYHVRCLTTKQLNSYGPRWHCPSCLCRECLTDKDDDKIVLCDSCDHAYHIYCMTPPRSSVPKGNWFCRQCESKILELRRIKRAYEKTENTLKGNEGTVNQEHITKNLGKRRKEGPNKGREGMDMLLTAALAAE